ncbi:MAG TPA: ABC transporter permease [Candidatus Babeliaceae bacterium]|nr:ABC transporter permease [Candidatus Babeliaceae bacterium]
MKIIETVGVIAIKFCIRVAEAVLFLMTVIKTLLSSKLKIFHVLEQMRTIGVGSFVIVFLTGSFAGLALALQTYIGFHRVGAEEFIGPVVGLAMTRELGPVLTGIMVTGRSGSAMAAELGTMQITEQVDALKTLCIDPFQYLIVPRVLASSLILPFLTIFSMICGVAGGYIFCVYILGLRPETYTSGIKELGDIKDITGGLIKAIFFGLILSWIGCYQGYRTTGGARGVGRATTKSVVIGSIMILIANYFLSSFLFQIGIS